MAVTTHNIIFKLQFLWSLGLGDGFRNLIDYGGFIKVPFLSYTSNLYEDQEGWFTTDIPFSFLRALLLNCYNKVRIEYEEFMKGRLS
ncbi:hypothetical protein C1I60_11080 [Paenibacillus terrae]|uniref:Uncharacterized protein n=1 Tax=Paenibacillus terrae TaxID=159743 RepID=A0A4U2Q3L3_9BACL|nr:hypothetical protein [Paenibacillus terrae]TKH43898.1 hypothetical protein C1I60_11080 [Paenibacillus terrae]